MHELLDAVFPMLSISYLIICSERKVVDYSFVELLVPVGRDSSVGIATNYGLEAVP
jgi:hypothetical protein